MSDEGPYDFIDPDEDVSLEEPNLTERLWTWLKEQWRRF